MLQYARSYFDGHVIGFLLNCRIFWVMASDSVEALFDSDQGIDRVYDTEPIMWPPNYVSLLPIEFAYSRFHISPVDSISTVAPHWSFGLLNRIELHNIVEIQSHDRKNMKEATAFLTSAKADFGAE